MPLSRLVDAIVRFRAGGARVREWSVYAVETRRISLGTRDRETGGAHAPLDLAEAFGARFLLVWDDGRVSTGEVDRSEIGTGTGRALERARSSAHEDPDAAVVAGPAPMPSVSVHDPGTAGIASGDTAPIAARLERVRRRVTEDGFRTWSGSLGAAEARARLVTSAGLDASVRATTWGWHVSLDGELGDGFRSRAVEPLESFDVRLGRLAETVSRLRRTAARIPSGKRPVLLHPSVVESFVLAILFENLDGASVAHGESHFRTEQFGSAEPVLREDLALRVDPLQPLRAGAYRFTQEGVPAAPTVFVDRGRLLTPVLNLKYARRLRRSPTAMPRDHDSIHLEGPEPLSLDEGLAAADGGALVLSVLGVHTQDVTSGDFSLSAPQALAVEGEALAGRVRATLSGNLFDALRSDALRMVRFEGFTTPGLLLECRL